MNKQTILYFLRSSEKKIVSDMIHYAYRLDETGKTKDELPSLGVYEEFYGLTTKDLGVYALVDKSVGGAIWTRLLKKEDDSSAFVDEKTPVLSMAVIPSLRNQGVGTLMMNQFLQEAAAVYEQISTHVLIDSKAIKFYEKFGFEKLEGSEEKSCVDGARLMIMIKKLEKKEVVRPSDGYDASYWMD